MEVFAITILACILIEQVAPIERFSLRGRIPGIAMNFLLGILSPAFSWPLAKLWHYLGISNAITVPLWTWLQPLGVAGFALQVLILVAFADFLAYWRHRAEHKWFWPIHAVHHCPTELHATNDIGHPAQVWANILFVSFPLSLIQFDGPETPFIVGFIVNLLSFYIHSPIDIHFGPLRKVLVDNRFHRIHHSLEPKHFDKNFSICFSLWDRWFGTAYDPEPDEWPSVGVDGLPPPKGIIDYLMFPLRVVGRAESRTDQPFATAGEGTGVSRSRERAAATALASAPTVKGLRSNS